MSHTVLAKLAIHCWKLLHDYGHDADAIFHELGLEPDVVQSADARIDISTANALWLKVAELIDDPCCGIKVAHAWHPSSFGALGYAWLASSSLRTAFNRLQRYVEIISSITEIELYEENHALTVTVLERPKIHHIPQYDDAALSVLVMMCRINAGQDFNPLQVRLCHEEYPCAGKYFEYFRCPIEFNASSNSLLLSLDDIDKPLPSANPQLANLNDQIMVKALSRLNRDNIEQSVKASIIEQFPSGEISQDKVASSLNMSTRNLQRKLHHENTSFREIIEQTRRELAKQYIHTSDMSLGEIAYLLGFAESSSFSRAYKRWYGISPSEARLKT